MKIAYLGPQGTYSEQAATHHAPGCELSPFPTIPGAVTAVEDGRADRAVVPIENSLEGPVTHTLDLLIHSSPLRICSEVVLPIHHCLVMAAGTARAQVRIVYSHPQALAQCRGYLQQSLPRAAPVASLSTANSVNDMLRSRVPAAAISSVQAAELSGVVIAERGIEDLPNNKTRFVVLSASDSAPTGDDRTSVCFDFSEDQAGSLHGALGEFATRGLNMIKIESRPDKRSLGRYYFLVDVNGHRKDPVVRDALRDLRSRVSNFKIFGSYPRVPRD